MRIGELAAKSGLEVATIRYYETLGLLPPPSRAPSGYRNYGAADLNRLAFIKHNQMLGFTLREIGLLKPLHSAVTRLATVTSAESLELQSIVAMLEEKQQDIDGKNRTDEKTQARSGECAQAASLATERHLPGIDPAPQSILVSANLAHPSSLRRS